MGFVLYFILVFLRILPLPVVNTHCRVENKDAQI